ncbi:VCBS repeat-containing protein, partial [bacterium]|nr:VCBS repeat-containing protein [bacterium]
KSEWEDPFYPVACPDVDVDDAEMVCRGQLTSHHFYEGSSHQWQYLMDINGDSLPDRVRAIECTGCADSTEQADLEIALNTGNGWSTSTTVWRDPAINTFPGMADNGKFFMDFNGDGLLDRIVINKLQETGEGTIWADGFYVYYNNGTGFDQTGVFWKDPLYTELGQDSLGRLNVTDEHGTKATIRDFNGDGLPDRMAVASFQDGDGNDLGTGIHVYLNRNGLEWAQPTEDGSINEIDHIVIIDKASEDKGYINTKHDWIDMNGDGFLDRIEGDPANSEFTVFYYRGITPSTGTEQLSAGETMTDPVTDGSDGCEKSGHIYNVRESNNNTRGFWLTHTMTADFNGDGYPDRLAISNCNLNENNKTYRFYPLNNNGIKFSDSPTQWDYKKVTQPDGALHSVSSGAGMTTVIEYMPSSWPRRWSSNHANLPITHRHLPFNLYLAHKIYTTDYTLNPADESSFVEAKRNSGMRWMTYEYFGGNFFIKNAVDSDGDGEPEENRFAEFNGFQSVAKTVHKSTGETWDDMITTSYYHQALSDYDTISASDETYFETLSYNHLAFSGKPFYTETEVGGVLRSWQESDYTVDLVSSSDMFNCDGICFPRLTTLVKSFQESLVSPQKTSSVSFNYDAYGNIAEENYYDSNSNEIITKSTSYYAPTTFAQELQIRNRPEEQNKEQAGTIYRKKD